MAETTTGWRPIAEAPKDGTRILVARAGEDVGCDEIEITQWCVSKRSHYEPVGDGLFRLVEDEPFEFWNGNGHRATHFMLLPAPPLDLSTAETMGWNTVAVILNDALGAIENDPNFGKSIVTAVQQSFGREGDPFAGEVDARGEHSVHCGAMRIISQCHADGEQVTIVSRNTGVRADDANDLGFMALGQMQRCLERHGYKVTKPKRVKAVAEG